MVLLVLFEHAAGYALVRCQEAEDIGSLLPEVQEAIVDFTKFSQVAHLEAFSPFKTGASALDNVNSVSEGMMHDDLKVFLMNNVPLGKKKSKVTLGVADPKLGGIIQETLDIQCHSGGVVHEVTRGVRLYFHRMVKGLTAPAAAKAQLGLGHSFSRAKVKFNVNRADNMIIQAISLLDQLDKDINTFSMRIREWYSYHFPELVKLVPDNFTYAKMANFIGDRKELSADKLEGLEEIVMDSAKAQAIVEAARVSMGMDISLLDLINIQRFSARLVGLTRYRRELSEYLGSKMTSVAPSLTSLIGEQVGARLISHAGSLTSLAKYPASTVQILGAEKALFRALKTRGNTPKYGLIFHSTFIGRAGPKNKGRISRYLANKCAIASRLDCFADFPSSTFGEKLRGQVEERLYFYETGKTPRRNIEVMQEAIKEVQEEQVKSVEPSILSSEKKKKKRKRETVETGNELATPSSGKKKRKRVREVEEEEQDMEVNDEDDDNQEETGHKPKKTKKAKKTRKSVCIED